MITAQIAFSVGILGGAALVQRAWVGSLSLEALPDADAIATAHLSRSAAPEDRGGPPAATAGAGTAGPAGLSEVAAAVRAAHPGSRVALSDHLPGVDAPRGAVEVEGQATPITVPVARVEPEFFGVVGAEALSGRLPDAPSSPAAGDGAAVVDLPFVERHLGSANAVGRRIRPASRGAEEGRWYEIVAVVPDLGLSGLDASAAGGLYLPFVEGPTARLLIRTPGDPRVVGATLPQIVYGVDPAIAVSRIHVLGAVVRGVRAVFQGLGAVFTGLGVLVLVLALMGVYAILAFEVSRRRREFGIRVALGASAPTLVRPLALRVGAYVAVGSGVGWLLGSVVVSTARAMIQLRTAPSGGAVFALLALVVLATAAAAAAAPTLRVLRIPPAEALQAD